jgi:mono/diheme cytochrome c family protein
MLFRVLIILVSLSSAVASGAQVDVTASLINPPLTGQDTFEFYCATCHGRDGTGDGPMASSLNIPPADLTMLAARNGGQFSPALVRELITHENGTPAHGSSEMPIWGPIFRTLEPSERVVETRIESLINYVESIQAR